jgi:hypothetical protein
MATHPKVKTKTVHEVDYSDFESIVCEHYGIPAFSVVASEETTNDTAITFSTTRAPLDYQQRKLAEWKAAPEEVYMYAVWVLAWDLAEAGVIPHGDYVIEVSW